MNLFRGAAVMAMLVLFFACGDPKPPKNTSTAGNTGSDGGPTIYDNVDPDPVDPEMEVTDYTVRDEPVIYEADRLAIDEVDRNATIKEDLNWDPIFFEFDKATLTEEAKASLQDYSQILMRNRNLIVLLEGHCDNRGTEEYNMALGERRAQQVKRYLTELGVGSNQLRTISYGELRPLVADDNEGAWARNRRVAFTF